MAVYKGWNAKLIKDISGSPTDIGYAESVTVDISLGTENYYELGAATAKEIVPGNVEVTGTIDRAWIDTELLTLIGLEANHSAPSLTEFNLVVSIPASSGGTQKLTVLSAQPETTAFDIPQDGFLTQSLDFRARDFEITA